MKLKIGQKLGLAFGIVLVLMLVSGVLTYLRLADIAKNVDLMVRVRVPTMQAARLLQDDLDYAGNKARQAILSGTDPARKAAAQAAFNEGYERVDREMGTFAKLSSGWTLQENRDCLADLKQRIPKIRQDQQATIDIAASGGRDAVIRGGNEYTDNVTPEVNAATKILGDMVQSFDDLIARNNQEIAAALSSGVWTLGITIALAIGMGAILAVFISRQLASATNAVLHQAEEIAAGDLSGEEIVQSSSDELGDLATAINKMHANLRQVIQSISENAQNVANASEEFSSVSQQITANSEETSAQANAVSAATEQVNRNLQTVATATEEMSASISEIAKNATEAARVAGSAMETANETNAIVSKLGESSAEIGQVIKTITSIAQKTDLLALNATVEAARAGEVGAGFAVVANEVKELAKQTAAATEDISRKIEAIQTDAKSAVNAISTISGIISQVNQISATIAAAVEEQSATTSEMSRNLTDAAKGAGEVAQNINGVAQAAQNTSHGAADSLKAAQQLAKMSTQLRGLVEQFKLDRTHVRRARSRRDPNVDLDTHTVGEREYEETGVR
jgi:methyl-accepting chemotaxis protein